MITRSRVEAWLSSARSPATHRREREREREPSSVLSSPLLSTPLRSFTNHRSIASDSPSLSPSPSPPLFHFHPILKYSLLRSIRDCSLFAQLTKQRMKPEFSDEEGRRDEWMNRASRFYHSPSLRRYFCRRELTRYSRKGYSPGTKRKEINYDTCVCIYIF